MTSFQSENQIVEGEDGESICLTCGNLLEPLYENNGFSEFGAEHQEFIGFKKCDHNED